MIDFTSALYLGLDHSTASLRPWKHLTNGAPAGVTELPAASVLAKRLASLMRLPAAALARSTLHAFWDVGSWLAGQPVDFFADAGAYPVALWGAQRGGRVPGAALQTFAHNDPLALHWSLRRASRRARRPVVLCDGVCGRCGRVAPIAAYEACVREAGGLLVIDDTQALGILGREPTAGAPYGRGGGGSVAWSRAATPSVLCVSSLAKGFGVPLAVIGGSQDMIEQILNRSETRQHCSQSSNADLAAADHALNANDAVGDLLRGTLLHRVRQFRELLTGANLWPGGGLFPAQTLKLKPGCDGAACARRLAARGFRALWRRNEAGRCLASFLVTAGHRPEEIAAAATAIAAELGLAAAPCGSTCRVEK